MSFVEVKTHFRLVGSSGNKKDSAFPSLTFFLILGRSFLNMTKIHIDLDDNVNLVGR